MNKLNLELFNKYDISIDFMCFRDNCLAVNI